MLCRYTNFRHWSNAGFFPLLQHSRCLKRQVKYVSNRFTEHWCSHRKEPCYSPSSPAAVGRRESSVLNACHSLMHCGGTSVSSDDAFRFGAM